jgi:hypothetical protein
VNPDSIRIYGFEDQKLKKKNTAENFLISFLDKKIAIYLSLGLHKGCPSYRRRPFSPQKRISMFI